MNKYTELSDFEVNLKVAHIILGAGEYDWCSHTNAVKDTPMVIKGCV